MKKITLLLLLLSNFINAQERMTTNSGIIHFEASIPVFEEVQATNEKAIFILEPETSKLNCIILVKQFHFKRALMETHFNENYIESDKYPKASFKGKIEKFDLKNVSNDAKQYVIRGKIEIHGKSKNIAVIAQIKNSTEGIEITSDFDLNTDDFKIEIPFIVRNKISKTVHSHLECVLH